MQDECDEIYPAVLSNVLRGQDAYDCLENTSTPISIKSIWTSSTIPGW